MARKAVIRDVRKIAFPAAVLIILGAIAYGFIRHGGGTLAHIGQPGIDSAQFGPQQPYDTMYGNAASLIQGQLHALQQRLSTQAGGAYSSIHTPQGGLGNGVGSIGRAFIGGFSKPQFDTGLIPGTGRAG